MLCASFEFTLVFPENSAVFFTQHYDASLSNLRQYVVYMCFFFTYILLKIIQNRNAFWFL